MKINRYFGFILPALIMAAVLTSCHGDLNIIQDNKLSASNMWKDQTDVEQSTYGIYQRIRANFVDVDCNIFYWGEVRVGDYMWGPSLESNVQDADMQDCRRSTMNSATASCSWSALYSAIDQANAVIKYAPIVEMDDDARGFCLGQALFARAYLYFWAARIWGGVPLNLVPVESTTQPETYPVRATAAEVYAQIGKDIEAAEQYASLLGTEKYFATADALYILKAEYALWMYTNQKGGDDYLTLAQDAIDAIGISASRLLTDYAKVFDYKNKCNSEMVFVLKNDMAEQYTGGFYQYFYMPNNLVKKEYCQKPVPILATQWWSYQPQFLQVLRDSRDKNGDKRVATNLGDGNYGAAGQNMTWCNKYLGDMSGAITVLDADIPYYRYALAVMLAAELEYYKKNYTRALDYVNIIAKRAYGKDNFYTTATKEGVLEALTNEYFLEFPAEGVIWWALIRLDNIWKFNPELKKMQELNPNILLWPISRSAINKNYKLTQTEGWS